ncbi:MAG: ATP-binding protein [Myxococcota bacterium]
MPTVKGRKSEVEALERELDRDRPSMVVVYGRRRVGKSTLLAHVCADRSAIYYQATEVVDSLNLSLFKEEVTKFEGEPSPLLQGLANWESVLAYVEQLAHDHAADHEEHLLVVFDEFPYLCEAVDGLPSVVQKVVDRVNRNDIPLDVVLCGSQISFMTEMLGEKSPLRGRQTLEMDVQPLPYKEAAEFFADWSATEALEAYGVFGGMPYYLQFLDSELGLRENIVDTVLRPGAPLGNEAYNVLQSELRTPRRFASVLQAIGTGCSTTGDILGRTAEISNGGQLTPYIDRLEALRLIRVTRSLDAKPKARNRRYYVADPYLEFWFRFGLPNVSALAKGHAEDVYDHAIEPQLSQYMGEIFEWISREFLERYADDVLSAPPREIGKIWGKDYDIDVAATLLDDTVVYAECKWWESPVGMNVLRDLRDDASKTDYGAGADELFVLFSKSGFTEELEREADGVGNIQLVGADDLL